jgi:predicted nuclease with TOPRIM domain
MITGLWALFKILQNRSISDTDSSKEAAKVEGEVKATLTGIKDNLSALTDHIERLEGKVDTFNEVAAQLKADRARIDQLEKTQHGNTELLSRLQQTVNTMQTDAIAKLAEMVKAVLESNTPTKRR